jgi:peptidoglycan/LPS O-acetylase OafA/YrhL
MNKYFKGLDGLRAYAVILVMLFHARIIWWGWVGVQIFFILSGFLITRILIKAKGQPNFFKVFYMRRILRIFPLYYLLLTVVIICAVIYGASYRDGILYVLYIQNYKLGFTNFTPNFPHAFDHTWSLAVEEQFYFIFPFIVYYFSKESLRWILAAMMAAGVVFIVGLPLRYPGSSINWSNTVSNFLFIGAGGLIASISRKYWWWLKTCLLCATGIGIVVHLSLSGFDKVNLTEHGGQFFLIALTPAIMLLVIYLIGEVGDIGYLIFKNPLSVYIGKISYGMYLFHTPIFFLCDQYGLPLWLKFGTTIGLSALSWHFFEARFIALKHKYIYEKTVVSPVILPL